MRRTKCYPKHTRAYKLQQQQALPFHFIFIIIFFLFFFLYFTIIKFLEFVSIYIVSWTELCVYLLNMFYSPITFKVGKVRVFPTGGDGGKSPPLAKNLLISPLLTRKDSPPPVDSTPPTTTTTKGSFPPTPPH